MLEASVTQTDGSFAYIASVSVTCQHQSHARVIAILRYHRKFQWAMLALCIGSSSLSRDQVQCQAFRTSMIGLEAPSQEQLLHLPPDTSARPDRHLKHGYGKYTSTGAT